jgi:hypothetical protein
MNLIKTIFNNLIKAPGKAIGLIRRIPFTGKTEYLIGILALAFWLAFEAGGRFLGWQTYPVGYFQKICFGILAMSIIVAVTWLWLGATFPGLKLLIDPDTCKLEDFTPWQQLKIALFFYCLYAVGALLLASLY